MSCVRSLLSALLATLLGSICFAVETRPIHFTVVDDVGRPVARAEVLLVDDDAVDAPRVWGEVDLVEWLVEHGKLAGHTDMDGVAAIEEAPLDVWALVQEGERSAIVKIHPGTHRNRRVTLEVDRPLRIRTVDGAGVPVPDVPIELSSYGGGPICGYGGRRWSGRTDGRGEAELPHPRYYLQAFAFEKPAESGCVALSVETGDGDFHYRDLDPSECVSGRTVEFSLLGEPDRVYPGRRRVCLRVRDDTGITLADGWVWFEVAGDPRGPLARDCLLGRSKGGLVTVCIRNELPAAARVLVYAKTSAGKEGRAALNPSELGDDGWVDVTLETVEPAITGVVVDARSGALSREARVTLYASLPLRDHPRDRAAAVGAMPDPEDPGRILWPLQSWSRQRGDRFEFAEPWPLFGGPDPRWFVVAEVEGWWRSDPVRVPDDRSPIEIMLSPRGR